MYIRPQGMQRTGGDVEEYRKEGEHVRGVPKAAILILTHLETGSRQPHDHAGLHAGIKHLLAAQHVQCRRLHLMCGNQRRTTRSSWRGAGGGELGDGIQHDVG